MVTVAENADSVEVSKLSSGLFTLKVKAYGDLQTQEGTKALIERQRLAVVALETLYPTANNKDKANIKDLEKRLEDTELREAQLTEKMNAYEHGGDENKESMGQ